MSSAEYGGLAYNCNGNRIAITCPNKAWIGGVDPAAPATAYTPSSPICPTDPYGYTLQQSSGNVGIPLKCTCPNCINTVWVDYLQVVNPSGQIVETNDAKTFLVEYTDGYKIYVKDDTGTYPGSMTPPTPTAIYLGRVCIAACCAVDNDETRRKYIMQRGETVSVNWPQVPLPVPGSCTCLITAQDHVCHVGSNTPTTSNPHGIALEDLGIGADKNAQLHQKYFHEKSIIHADPASTTSALYPTTGSGCTSIQGLFGSPTDERVNVDVNVYKSDDTVYHKNLSGVCSCCNFSVDYCLNFCTNLPASCCYYFYIDASLPAAPLLTVCCTGLPTDMTSIYPIYAVWWCCATCAFSGAQDLRIFKNSTAQSTWTTGGHTCLCCEGRFGYNNQTCQFEGYNGTDWLPMHGGCTFYACETGAAGTCYCYAHGLGARPDVVLINQVLGSVSPATCGFAWEDVSKRGTVCLVVCTDASVSFEVFAWIRNT
jgi:hypothetical protein